MEVSAFIMGNLQLIVDSREASTWPEDRCWWSVCTMSAVGDACSLVSCHRVVQVTGHRSQVTGRRSYLASRADIDNGREVSTSTGFNDRRCQCGWERGQGATSNRKSSLSDVEVVVDATLETLTQIVIMR